MDQKRWWISEAAGVQVVFLTAMLLRSVYALSGRSTLAILFGAVNGSAWEQTKAVSAGYVGYAVLEILWLHVPFRRYVIAKVGGLYLLSGCVIGGCYLLRAVGGTALLPAVLLAAAAGGFWLSYRLTMTERETGELFPIALLLLMLYFLMFFSFTIFPPRIGLFRDPAVGTYGIEEYLVDAGAIAMEKFL